MKNHLLKLAILLLLFSNHCSNSVSREILIEEKNNVLEIVHEKVKSAVISDIGYPSVFLDNNNVYINGLTMKGQEIPIVRKYDSELNFLSDKTFCIGQGPSDLGGGSQFFSTVNAILVPDNLQKRVNIFDKNFCFVKFVNIPSYLPITFIKGGEYFIGSKISIEKDKASVSIELVTFPGLTRKKIHSIAPIKVFEPRLIIGNSPEFEYFYKYYRNSNRIYFINMNTYTVIVFDLNGKIIKKVRLNVSIKKVPKEIKNLWLSEQSPTRRTMDKKILTDWIQPATKAIPLEKGFVVIRREGYSTDCSGLVDGDYFNYDLELLGKVKFPCFYRIFTLRRGQPTRSIYSSNGFIYLVNDNEEEYFLEKWRITE